MATDWNPAPNRQVFSLLELDDRLFVGGEFTVISGQSRSRLAELNLAEAVLTNQPTAWNPRPSSTVYSLGRIEGSWVAAGAFSYLGTQFQPALAVFRAAGYSTLSGETALGGYQLQLTGNNGEKHAVLATTNFVDWTALVTNTVALGGFSYFDPESTNIPMRFYRSVSTP